MNFVISHQGGLITCFWGMSEMNRTNCKSVIKKLILSVVATVFAAAFATVINTDVYALDTTQPLPQELPEQVPVVVDPVDAFLAQSAFIGNSVGDGLTMYNNAKGKVPLGNAVMLTRVSYSFYSDSASNTRYLPRLNGVPMRAKDAIKNSGVSYVFICMGTNDLVGSSGAENAYEKYQQYIAGILADNPFVTIFIESCTPTRPGSNVNNDKVKTFNAYMQAFCDTLPNLYYVDIATPLSDADGYLSAPLSSDGSVHLTNKAYEIWANTIRAYITNFLVARSVALAQQHEEERAIAQANYEASMKKMEEKKQEAFKLSMQAKREEEEAEAARRKYELLNVIPGRQFEYKGFDTDPWIGKSALNAFVSVDDKTDTFGQTDPAVLFGGR